MMEELKTLKDIGFPCNRIAKDDLKEEAIKWIKHLRGIKGEFCSLNVCGLMLERVDYEQDDLVAIEKFIKHFFNITDEEVNE